MGAFGSDVYTPVDTVPHNLRKQTFIFFSEKLIIQLPFWPQFLGRTRVPPSDSSSRYGSSPHLLRNQQSSSLISFFSTPSKGCASWDVKLPRSIYIIFADNKSFWNFWPVASNDVGMVGWLINARFDTSLYIQPPRSGALVRPGLPRSRLPVSTLYSTAPTLLESPGKESTIFMNEQ